jgi:DNA polymerase-3 subunit epsilon
MIFPPWFQGRALSFDTETTGVDVSEDRIITAHIVQIGPSGIVAIDSWLVNPGIPIPEGATNIHGITDEMVADYTPPAQSIPWIIERIRIGWVEGLPLIVCNAPYDLSLLSAEAERLGIEMPEIGPVLDPLVIDRACDKYRKGSRKLDALAAFYGVPTGKSHSSEADALCAASVVWMQSQKWKHLQDMTIDQMQVYQRARHADWARGFQEFKRKSDPSFTIETGWPVRD